MKPKTLCILPIVLALAACQPPAAVTAEAHTPPMPAPVARVDIDTSTPDRALRSYWSAKDAYLTARNNLVNSKKDEIMRLPAAVGFNPAVLTAGNVLASHDKEINDPLIHLMSFSREIVKLEHESDSRAVAYVTVRNATPIPPGAVVTERDMQRREAGEKFKYVLEKDAHGWKVANVYIFDRYRDEPWHPVFRAPEAAKEIYGFVWDQRN